MRYVVLAIKLLLVPAGLIALAASLLDDPRFPHLSIGPLPILAALALNQVALLLFAIRMKAVMGAFGVPVSVPQSLRIHLQSMFYFFALPMTVGLEVARFAKIKRLLGDRADNAGLSYALLADRMVGALAAVLVAAALLPFVGVPVLKLERAIPGWVAAGLGACVLVGGYVARSALRRHLEQALDLARKGRGALAAALAVALVTHVTFILGVQVAAAGMGLGIATAQTLFAISAAMLFVVIPVSFAGVSPVEAACAALLVGLGVPIEAAAVLALIAYLAKLVAAFEGGAWEMLEGGGQLARDLARNDPPGSR